MHTKDILRHSGVSELRNSNERPFYYRKSLTMHRGNVVVRKVEVSDGYISRVKCFRDRCNWPYKALLVVQFLKVLACASDVHHYRSRRDVPVGQHHHNVGIVREAVDERSEVGVADLDCLE